MFHTLNNFSCSIIVIYSTMIPRTHCIIIILKKSALQGRERALYTYKTYQQEDPNPAIQNHGKKEHGEDSKRQKYIEQSMSKNA